MLSLVESRRVRIALGLLFLAAIGAWVYWSRTRVDLQRTYRVGTRGNTLSREAVRDGRVDALGVAVVSEAARRAGVRVEWVDSPEGPDEALKNGRAELWPMMNIVPERKRAVHITAPWISTERCLVTKEWARPEWRGATVAYGFGQAARIGAALPGAETRRVNNEIAALQAMCSGGVDGAFVTVHSLSALVHERPKGCETIPFRVTPFPSTSQKSGIGARPEIARVADRIRTQIGSMARDGVLSNLFEKYGIYGGIEHDVYELVDAEDRSRMLAYGSAGLTAALGILIWQMRRTREARKVAEHANSAKSQFLANMSHEIRTPLHAISGMTELLGKADLPEHEQEMVDVIRVSSESLITIVNDILDLSKVEAGAMQVEEIAFDLRTTVESVGKLLRPRAEAKGVGFEIAFQSRTPRGVRGDPLRIRQVLLNLAANAIKFTEKGKVRIEAAPAGDAASVVFRVIDTGIGIDAEAASKIFDPFTQADSATTRKYGGTGLGLTICRRLVTLMGGSIGVESELGKGSVFWFVLPLEPAPEVCEADRPQRFVTAVPVSTYNSGRILIVEDNPVNQLVALKVVQHLGYETEIAGSGEAALEMIQNRRFDLILMDCQMPHMDGYQTTAEIRMHEGAAQRIPIVAMTANSVEGDEERCTAAGMDGYLTKPLRIAALKEALERWIAVGQGVTHQPV